MSVLKFVASDWPIQKGEREKKKKKKIGMDTIGSRG